MLAVGMHAAIRNQPQKMHPAGRLFDFLTKRGKGGLAGQRAVCNSAVDARQILFDQPPGPDG